MTCISFRDFDSKNLTSFFFCDQLRQLHERTCPFHTFHGFYRRWQPHPLIHWHWSICHKQHRLPKTLFPLLPHLSKHFKSTETQSFTFHLILFSVVLFSCIITLCFPFTCPCNVNERVCHLHKSHTLPPEVLPARSLAYSIQRWTSIACKTTDPTTYVFNIITYLQENKAHWSSKWHAPKTILKNHGDYFLKNQYNALS